MKANSTKVLIIMDGFGRPLDAKRSAVLKKNTKFLQFLHQKYPSGLLNASEESVGLPMGQTGTSDVGHLTIGTGRVTYQPLVRINKDIQSGEFFKNAAILKAIDNAKNGKALHLLGIPSDGGVHSHIDHLLALLELCKKHKLKKVYVHFFADGRDVPPKSVQKYIDIVQTKINELGVGEIVNVVGRLYALDRDNNWDRVEIAYNMMTKGEGTRTTDLSDAISKAYESGQTDEFLLPIVKVDKNNNPKTIQKGDSVIIYNYRADRERQLAYALSDENNLQFTQKLGLTICCMTEYNEDLHSVNVAYPNIKHKNMLSQVLSQRGYKQLKIAETEKYAYITFAFNGGLNQPFKNEDRSLVASEKLKIYNKKPEMSAREIAQRAVDAIKSKNYDCVIINFANCDMVGHSGDKRAAEIAVGVVDECVEKVAMAALAEGGELIVSADHGNSDIMQYPDGSPHTSHTLNLVPVFIVGKQFENKHFQISGSLADIAPTFLKLLDEEIPKEMTGKPLY